MPIAYGTIHDAVDESELAGVGFSFMNAQPPPPPPYPTAPTAPSMPAPQPMPAQNLPAPVYTAPPQPQPQPAPQPMPQAPPPMPTAGYPGVVVTQAQPTQPYAQQPQQQQPQQQQPVYAQPAQPVQSPYAPPPQPQAAPPPGMPAWDAVTLKLPPAIRSVLRPGESIARYTKVPLSRKFWHPSSHVGEAIHVYVVGAEWHVHEGMKLLFYQVKMIFAGQSAFETGVAAVANQGEIVLVPVTAEIERLSRMLKDANAYVPDAIFYSNGNCGGVDVYVLNDMVPRATVDAR